MQLYAKQNQYYALYLDISCLISSPVETTLPMKNIKKKRKLIKSLLFQKVFQTWPYYLFIYYLTVHMSKFTQIMVNDNIFGFR